MSALGTLAALKKTLEKNSSGQKRNFLTLKDGDAYTVRFLQELALDGSKYSEDRGTAAIVPVHTNPLDFKKKAACVAEEGYCWACEQVGDNTRWRAVNHVVIAVAYRQNLKEDWKVGIFDTTFSGNKVGTAMVDYADAYGTLVGHNFKLSRRGSGMNDTEYTLIGLQEENEPAEFAEFVLPDVNTVYRRIESDEQEDYFNGVSNDKSAWA